MAMDPRRSIYGLLSVGLADEGPLSSMTEMTEKFLTLVRQIQPGGPYYLVGWSFGGLVAHGVARRLQAQNERVALFANVHAYTLPSAESPPELDENRVIEDFARLVGRL
jgi:thioesterase domain-containing protein